MTDAVDCCQPFVEKQAKVRKLLMIQGGSWVELIGAHTQFTVGCPKQASQELVVRQAR